MKTKVLIVEDELIVAEDIKEMLQKTGYDVVGTALNYTEAVDLLEKHKPDFALLDINLGGAKDGIELAAHINLASKIPFVFATSNFDELTLKRAKDVKPNGYLLKPFDKADLYTCIEIAIAGKSQHTEQKTESNVIKDALFVKDGNYYVRVSLNDILWLKADGNYTEIYTEGKRHVIRAKLKEFEDKLGRGFVRIHKSYTVNLGHIDAINSAEILVKGNEIPMGSSYKDELMTRVQKLT